MRRGTTPSFEFKWENGSVDVEMIEDVCVSFYQSKSDHLLPLHMSEGRVILALNGVAVTLTQQETLDFEKGRANIQLKIKFSDGTVWASDYEQETVDDILHEEVF